MSDQLDHGLNWFVVMVNRILRWKSEGHKIVPLVYLNDAIILTNIDFKIIAQ